MHMHILLVVVAGSWPYLRTVDTCAQGEAHSRVVMATPTKGSQAVNFFTKSWKNSLATTPTRVGTNTTWNVDTARPCMLTQLTILYTKATHLRPQYRGSNTNEDVGTAAMCSAVAIDYSVSARHHADYGSQVCAYLCALLLSLLAYSIFGFRME